MLFAPKYTPEQWAEARRLRAEGLIFAVIGERVGIKPETIASRARKERWSGSPGPTVAAAARRRKAPVSSPATAQIRRVLALRLYSLLELKIRMMELRMKKQLDVCEQSPAGAEPPAVTKDERETFAALIESINQVTEMASDPPAAADGRRKSASAELTALSADIDAGGLAIASEKDQFRAEIAERLGKLFPQS